VEFVSFDTFGIIYSKEQKQ